MLLLLFGPPAVGKMTVGRAVAARSSFALFHNHMTIEPLLETFGFGTPPFTTLNREFRRRVLEEAAAHGVDLLFTLVWALDSPEDVAEMRSYVDIFDSDVAFVELRADLPTRLARNRTEHRLLHKASKRDVDWSDDNLRTMEADWVMTSQTGLLEAEGLLARHPHLVLDTAQRTAEESAAEILRWLGTQVPATGDGPRGTPRRRQYGAPMSYVADPEREARIRELTRRHVLTSWSAQGAVDPLPVAGGEGAYFWDHQGRRFLDLSSQLVNVNIGYQHPRLTAAIQEAAGRITTVAPAFAEESRAEAARMVSELAPEGMHKVFFTNGGAEANENALRAARAHTGRHKILAAYRSYHGATAGAITLTGEARRWGAEPGIPGVVHFWGPYLYRSEFSATTQQEESERALAHLRRTVEAEGPHQVAAIFLETVVGSNGILVPPPGYLEGVRALCDEHGILLVLDEVMSGFGRTGAWFALDHWGVRPDLISFAKGVNSGYVPLGGLILSDEVAATFEERPFPGGLTYSGHALATASAVAAMTIMREEGIVEHAAELGERTLGPALRDLADASPLVGDVRGLGVFWALELVEDRETRAPLDPGTMKRLQAACQRREVWPLVMGNRVHVVPPLVISHEDAARAVRVLAEALAEVTP